MSWFAEFIELMGRIPATFWGVVAGSFFSLGGVILTNRASEKRLRAQFAHERELRNRDRELALRKDIYLEAAEAISAGFISIGSFPNLEISHEKVTEGYIAKAPAIAKVQVVANEETARKVIDIASELSAIIYETVRKTHPVGFAAATTNQLE